MSATLFALVPLYAVADSFAGGSLGSKAKALDERLPGRAAFWGALLCAGAGWLLAGVPGALMGLVWLIYRSPGWKVFGGSATPVGARAIAGTFARHLLAMLALPVVFWAGKSVALGAIAFMAYAISSTAVAIWYAERVEEAAERGEPIDPDDNRFLELFRGALFGLATAVTFSA